MATRVKTDAQWDKLMNTRKERSRSHWAHQTRTPSSATSGGKLVDGKTFITKAKPQKKSPVSAPKSRSAAMRRNALKK